MPLIYRELHAIAERHMRRECKDHTLQATVLMHGAFLQLAGTDGETPGDVLALQVPGS